MPRFSRWTKPGATAALLLATAAGLLNLLDRLADDEVRLVIEEVLRGRESQLVAGELAPGSPGVPFEVGLPVAGRAAGEGHAHLRAIQSSAVRDHGPRIGREQARQDVTSV